MTNIAEENLDRESEFEDSRDGQTNGFVRNMMPIDMHNTQQEEEMYDEDQIQMLIREFKRLQNNYEGVYNENQQMKEVFDYARQ